MSDPLLSIANLNVVAGDRVLVRDATATIPTGKISLIVGPSGAGKSVLLRILAGLQPRRSEGLNWSGRVAVAPGNRVGVVFQQFALFDELSPLGNVQFALDHRAEPKVPVVQSAADWLRELGVPDHVAVANLSGGQKQRLAIARTLAAGPRIVLYDEPTSGLDAASGRRVAELIRQTHVAHQRTSIVVTHDYQTLLPIADRVLVLETASHSLTEIPSEHWERIAERIQPVPLTAPASHPRSLPQSLQRRCGALLAATGATVVSALRLPLDLLPWFPRPRWGLRFWLHYLRLVGGPSAWIYLLLAGMIAGFTTTYFTLRFLPFRLYTQPLLIDELLASIGFALYRILVPVLATVLIAARCGAAIAADVGVKRYNGSIDALATLGVTPQVYLLVPITGALLVATPLLEWLAFTASHLISLITFSRTHADIGPWFWQQHFFRHLETSDSWRRTGWHWVLLKNGACALGTAVIAYYQGIAPKDSAADVSRAITVTVLWATLFVLVVHFVVALLEF